MTVFGLANKRGHDGKQGYITATCGKGAKEYFEEKNV